MARRRRRDFGHPFALRIYNANRGARLALSLVSEAKKNICPFTPHQRVTMLKFSTSVRRATVKEAVATQRRAMSKSVGGRCVLRLHEQDKSLLRRVSIKL